MKKILLLISLLFFSTGCFKSFKGKLIVHSEIAIFSERGEKVVLEPGRYEIEVQVGPEKKAILKYRGDHFVFQIPVWKRIPKRDGERLMLSSDQSRQPYDIEGFLFIKREDIGRYREHGRGSCGGRGFFVRDYWRVSVQKDYELDILKIGEIGRGTALATLSLRDDYIEKTPLFIGCLVHRW